MAAAVVIIGSGLAGYTMAREIRKLNRDLPITLITREEGYFYSKPMLSTALAQSKAAQDLVTTPADVIAAQLGLTLMPQTTVDSIDTLNRIVHTSAGSIPYGSLVLALGADPIRVPLQGNAAGEVLSVNDLADYAAFRQALQGHRRVAILGAGLIGTEFANDLVSGGHEVDVIDLAPQPLGRLLPAMAADFLKTSLQNAGVRWHLNTTVGSVERPSPKDDLRLTLSNGQTLHAGIVLSAIGLRPRIDLARAAGIQVKRGIEVNRRLLTSADDVYALGDCAEVEGLVLPYVMPIMHSARVIAARLAGQDAMLSYPAMPVAVKTPAAPCVVSPPQAGIAGQWHEAATEDGVDARFISEDGQLAGFALVGAATAQKMALTKLLPAVL